MADRKENRLNFLLKQASAYSQFLINKVPEKIRKQLNNTQDKLTASFETSKKDESQQKNDELKVANHPLQKVINGGKLRGYQLQGVEWLSALYQNGLNGILADEMGLGKTIQVVAFVGHLRALSVYGPILIVAPLSTLRNWVKEFKKWLPNCPVCLYHGNKQERAKIRSKNFLRKQKDPKFPVVVTSYEMTIADRAPLGKLRWIELIVDEGHRLKNMDCKLIKTLKSYDSQNRLLLTGTPLQNNLRELWSLMNFLLPEIFDSLESFEHWFDFTEKTIEDDEGRAELIRKEANNQVLSKLHEILRPFVLRRLKIHVLHQLPEKKEIVLYPGLTEIQKMYYKSIVERNTQKVLGIRVSSLQNSLMQLRKVCNHPYLVYEPGAKEGNAITDENLVECCAKMKLLDRMLKRLLKNKHKILIFSQMTRMLDILQDYCGMRGWRACRLDGSMATEERQENIDKFQSSDRFNIFLLSTRAGGLGLNLTAADTCFIYDSDWNPHQDSQAQDRCHRFGQTKTVMVYRFITPNSVESQLLKRATSKRKLETLVITKGKFNKRRRAEENPKASVTLEDLKVGQKSENGTAA